MKKKQSVNSLMKEYGLSTWKSGRNALRYKSIPLKGIAWYWFAKYIRLRDAQTWGKCISCGKPKTFEELDAGHFAPARDCGLGLLMDALNVNGECFYCNQWNPTHLWGYEKNLDIRYGTGIAESLKKRYENRNQIINKVSDWGKLALYWKKKFEEL